MKNKYDSDADVLILTNHLGYTPEGAKFCVLPSKTRVEQAFHVMETSTGKAVYTGKAKSVEGDLGVHLVFDFSSVNKPGTYYIISGNFRSYPFLISDNVYDEAVKQMVKYFSAQRCGPSTTGYLSPCHLDDGKRLDNGCHQDVTGGWHDASDLRKWVSATLYGMIGLEKVMELLRPEWDRGNIEEEIRWGNRYFLHMQEPAGYIMHNVGGDIFEHGDSNRWTDNVIGTEDDRIINTDPAPLSSQYIFSMVEAKLSGLLSKKDPAYSKECLDAAVKCFSYHKKSWEKAGPVGKGAAILACLELFKTTGENKYGNVAFQCAKSLMALQEKGTDRQLRGYFYDFSGSSNPHKEIWQGCLHLIGLCELYRIFPGHEDAAAWKETIRLYCEEYILAITQRNNFGIVPYGLYTNMNPGGDRHIDKYWYRYFMEIRPLNGEKVGQEGFWWVGINANLASTGVALLKAYEILKNDRLLSLAFRQLDWILGVNPFNASTVDGIGRNVHEPFIAGQFIPPTPRIRGAVLNGIGGTEMDEPDMKSGSWQTCEYWTPMVCYTMWLIAELTK